MRNENCLRGKAIATSPEERRRKIDAVGIDFERDNVLPGLNAEDLAALGKPDKPVLLKKGIIEKNELGHPEVKREDSAGMIGQALYDHDLIVPGHIDKPYFNFVSRIGSDRNTVCLLELEETKDNYEIVNWHWAYNKNRALIEKKGERIKSARSGREGQP